MRVILILILAAMCNMDLLFATETASSALPANRVDVYYLHNTFRCLSCNTIEDLTKAAIFGGKAENQKFKSKIDVKPIYTASGRNLEFFASAN